MRRKFIAGNWKMYGTQKEVESLLKALKVGLAHFLDTDVAVFPSFVHLQQARDLLQDSPIGFGAQNLNAHDTGAYTGEISGLMLKDLGCHYVLVGHSERRQLFGETDAIIAEKFAAALKHQLTPVLCVGETQAERENNQTESVVLAQLQAVLDKVGIDAFSKAIIAYEPVWAIGTGLTATPAQAQAVHAFIRARLAEHNAPLAQALRIVYGGSVKGSNAAEIFSQPDVDGGLVGGASLKAEEFVTICRS
ncbi:MAG: triose-phosphate isomerase [Gammaproteobacteria bacterium GWF2_41_13]|nr:MAG: triose-phosphate isomerase [Gammaproteobacteria bacterium GWF2_41_13]